MVKVILQIKLCQLSRILATGTILWYALIWFAETKIANFYPRQDLNKT